MTNDNDTLVGSRQGEGQEIDMAVHDIKLTATMDGLKKIKISGSKDKTKLGKGSGSHKFKFTLDDQTKHKVEFERLLAADNCSMCPPHKGKPNTQIDDIDIDNSADPRTASFKDKNDNDGEMDVSYQWTFTCDDKNIDVEDFDPIITNGGR